MGGLGTGECESRKGQAGREGGVEGESTGTDNWNGAFRA